MFKWIGKKMITHPIRVVAIVGILGLSILSGAMFVVLKTGNDTFIDTDTDVYQNTDYYAETYGDSPIIIMFDPTSDEKVVDMETMNTMKQLEEEVRYHDGIHSIASPVTILENMSERQRETYLSTLDDMEKGLEDSAEGLDGFRDAFEDMESELDPEMMDTLDTTFQDLASGQSTQEDGLNETATDLETMSASLLELSEAMGEKAEAEDDSTLMDQANTLEESAMSLSEVPNQLTNFSDVAAETNASLLNLNDQLQSDLGAMYSRFESLDEASSKFSEMSEGFIDMAEGLSDMQSNANLFHAGLPGEEETLETMLNDDDGNPRDAFDSVIVDDAYALMTISIQGTDEATTKAVIDTVNDFLDDSDYSGETLISGKPVLDASIKDSMQESLPVLIALALGTMLAILLVAFHVRWRVLPLFITLFAVVITIGAMGYLEVPITMVSMAVFPILIGLGIDYSIEFQNRYTEILEEGKNHE
ncbi:MAG: MMPL family transporter [Bacillota bacterium]